MLSLIYIAGYIQKKGGEVKENDSFYYHQNFGKYFDALNKGSLTLPQDSLVHWCTFCVIFFLQVLDTGCPKILISVRHGFCASKKHCAILCNILLKNYSVFCTPRSSKESGSKVLKLS